ncbi:Protein CBG03642 [Caenorhabditis briggsae]|uniref:Uncharacterized protein n=2 Tax=Caenorhabditis briggsae TaxID=6238 RepID=A0AAE9DEK0_CAEBR|nr:Protein CBG03642 [Caenorhabditis briggsae]ULU02606.1 hypothetical protein L3Y34_002293 [Caenorhabditis briggsae]UMM25224.1 hypothetical protein L5515_005131 [Caenorhabditis briggsae]CAP24491.1 Protein CBG03642 [Caenorhabditis briggsae]
MPRILRRFPRCCIPPTIWESSREDYLQDVVNPNSHINPNWSIIRFFFMFAGYDFEYGKATVKEKAPFVKEYVPDNFLDSQLENSTHLLTNTWKCATSYSRSNDDDSVSTDAYYTYM